MELSKCLAKLPFRHLLIIARQHQIYRGQNPSKAELVDRLTVALLRPDVINRALQRLSHAQREALDAVVAAGGELPWRDFRQRFGDIRPYRPWREEAPERPWEAPISPAEALWFRGLIYRLPRRPRSGQQVRIVIPDALLERLPRPEAPAVGDAAVADATPVGEAGVAPGLRRPAGLGFRVEARLAGFCDPVLSIHFFYQAGLYNDAYTAANAVQWQLGLFCHILQCRWCLHLGQDLFSRDAQRSIRIDAGHGDTSPRGLSSRSTNLYIRSRPPPVPRHPRLSWAAGR